MPGALYQYFADDHDRLERLLQQATGIPGVIDTEAYAGFRKGLLRHIAIEEKIVLPAIAEWQGGRPADIAGRIRLDHGAIVSLLVPPPSASIIATLRSILTVHNIFEEQERGLYQLFEEIVGPDTATMLDRMRSAPEVAVLPHNEQPVALEAARRAVSRAGYEFKEVGD